METTKIKALLQKYFEGETSPEEEKMLENYFNSGKVDSSLQEYAQFFEGISKLAGNTRDRALESDIMDYILENETKEKSKYRWLWQTVTSVAASVIIILGGFLYYQQQESVDDTFKDPDEAYAYAVKTLGYVSGKYNKGMAGLSKFDKLQKATQPVRNGIAPVNEFYQTIEKMKTPATAIKNKDTHETGKSNDSI